MHDVVVIGGGPAGCSAASWLSQMGLSVSLVDRAPSLCHNLLMLKFAQNWVLGKPDGWLSSLGEQYRDHLALLPNINVLVGQHLKRIVRSTHGWEVELSDGCRVFARALLLATGLTLSKPQPFFFDSHADGAPDARSGVMDALSLTQRRAILPAKRTLLLGGGDNALENALYLHAAGHKVTLWSRSSWRAQQMLQTRLLSNEGDGIEKRTGFPMPNKLFLNGDKIIVVSEGFGIEEFDHVAALFGYVPEPSSLALVSYAFKHAGIDMSPLPWSETLGLKCGFFVAGDISERQHPCVQTALGDGVIAAKQIECYLHKSRSFDAVASPPYRNNQHIIYLSGLKFGANLGILESERQGTQLIQVDAEVNLGAQGLILETAQIDQVLDYRVVRQIIIDVCTAGHTDLLEALLTKLGVRLMDLNGVLGVRIKLTKLEVFPDCKPSISAEFGTW